ncbi:hypothetical protein DFJ73DRAFT_22239 [Zopfochytrium polystomum]|nr:hypothetical protein DFJ73DRAFT_22239 [Zopfochytrium polystomum]
MRNPIVVLLLIVLALFVAVASVAQSTDAIEFRSYIVVFKDGAATSKVNEVLTAIKDLGGKVKTQFKIIHAFSVDFPTAFFDKIKNFPQVDYVEEDGQVFALNKDDDDDAHAI